MDETLQKIDDLRRRTGASYREAKEALDAAGGDVVAALLSLEGRVTSRRQTALRAMAGLLRKAARLIDRGNRSRIVISRDGEVLMEMPVTLCVLGAVTAPWVCALSCLAVMAGRLAVGVTGPDRETSPGG